jgi:hypothetical protein
MRATQFVLLSVAVAVALSQPPGFAATLHPASTVSCWHVDAVRC